MLGEHEGVLRYTVGQRKGLGISGAEPLYVVALDAENARVIVGPREALSVSRVDLRDLNWIGDIALAELPPGGIEVAVRVRSTRAPREARLLVDDKGVHVLLAQGEEGVSPGQACVIYDHADSGARVLGGGVIMANRVPHPAPQPEPAYGIT